MAFDICILNIYNETIFFATIFRLLPRAAPTTRTQISPSSGVIFAAIKDTAKNKTRQTRNASSSDTIIETNAICDEDTFVILIESAGC